MKMKEGSEKVGLKLSIQKTKIMASGPITSWQRDGETVETVSDFIQDCCSKYKDHYSELNYDYNKREYEFIGKEILIIGSRYGSQIVQEEFTRVYKKRSDGSRDLEPEIKLPTSAGSWKKQESSRKTPISALLTMPKPLTVWITRNCGKF